MDRLGRALKWLFVGTGLLLALALIGAALYTRTEQFTRWLRDEGVAAVNDTISGTIGVERLEGSIWRHLTLYDVVLRHENAEVVRIARVDVWFSLFELIWGRLNISRLEGLDPQVILRQDGEGRWNVAEALAPRAPQPEQSSEFSTLIETLRLRRARIDLQRAADQGRGYLLENFDISGTIGILPDGVSLRLSEINGGLRSAGLPPVTLKGALAYRKTANSPPIVEFTDLWAVSQRSRIKSSGEIAPEEPLRVKAEVTIDKLAAADIAQWVPDWPLKPDLSGSVTVDGTMANLTGAVSLTGAGAKLASRFRADVEHEPVRYSATMTLSDFDVRQWLGRADLAGVVSGSAEARGSGFTLGGTTATTDLKVRSTQIAGWALGALALQARVEKSTAVLSGRLESTLGAARWSGNIGFAKARPTYDLTIAVKDFNIERVAADATSWRGNLNFDGKVQGAGLRLAELDARASLRLLPSVLGPLKLQKGDADVALRDNRLQIMRASLDAADSNLTVNGEIGIAAQAPGKLEYRFRAPDVAPWLSLFNQQGAGAVNVAGIAQGSLSELRTQGTARLVGVRTAGIGARGGNVSYDLRRSSERRMPQGLVRFLVTGFEAGLALRRLEGTANLAPDETVGLDVTAQDNAERKHSLRGTLSLAASGMSLRLTELALTSPDGSWKLVAPATLAQRGAAYAIEQLSLRNGERRLSLDGTFAFTGEQNLRLEVDRFPLETVAAFLPEPPKVGGLLHARAEIRGTAAAPELAANLKLSDPAIAGQRYAGADAEVNYGERLAKLRLNVQQDANHSLIAQGAVPLRLSWHDRFALEPAGSMDVRVQSAGINIGFLNAFSGKAADNIAGQVVLDLIARGSFREPDVRGSFALRDGRVRLVPLNVDIHSVQLAGALDSRSLTVNEVTARAKDGEIRGSGALALKQFAVSGVKLNFKAQRWPAIDTARYQLRVGGNVEVGGTLAAPLIGGRLNIDQGSLRPDLAFLEQSKAPTRRDPTIVVIKGGEAQASEQQGNGGQSSAANGFFDNLALDLAVRAPGNLWIRHPDLVSELSGDVRVRKEKTRDLDLTGRIEVVRGWFAFQGRRFQITRGTVQFTGGGKINPAIELTAEYRLPEYQVEARVSGTADKPSLALSSQPPLEQADILALVLFGRPLNTLDKNEQSSLQQSAVNLASGFVAAKIASSVATALGLDSLGIDIREVSSGQVGIGRYIGNRTYVSASQQLSGEHGNEVSLEYKIARDWKIGTSATSTGESGIDIIWHKRY